MAFRNHSRRSLHKSTAIASVASVSRVGLLCTAIALTGCAAPYAPYTGNDAAKVRLTLANGAIFSSVASNVRPVIDGQCGAPARLQQLFPYFGPPRDVPGRTTSSPGSQTPVVYPRAGMVDSPDALRSDAIELQLPPGKHLFSFIAGTGRSNCGVGAGIDLQPGRQYVLDFRFDTVAQRCVVTAKRLEATDRAEWRSYGFMAGETCRG